MADGHGVKHAVQGVGPEVQELVQHRKLRKQVVLLPDVALQQGRMVGHVVEDFRRGQPVALELLTELDRSGHSVTSTWSRLHNERARSNVAPTCMNRQRWLLVTRSSRVLIAVNARGEDL